MANVRIQPGRALTVIPSDDADVPFPAVNTSGFGSSYSLNQLIDSSKDFVALNVYAGDIVYCPANNKAATVTNNPSPATPTVLELNADIFITGNEFYVIYQSSAQAGAQNTGCVLYVGTSGDLTVTTTGQDVVTFVNIQDGSFIPVQILKVWAGTSAQNIVALW